VKKYANATDIVWCQDEPQNQGAWFFIQHNIHENMLKARSWATPVAPPPLRQPSATHLHQEQQKALVEGAFAKLKGFVLTK
jgi:2-oxoglutarate dehydrogenase E1 component